MAPRTEATQLADAILRSFFARAIGEAVYRADRNDATANLTQLTPPERIEYERTGAFVMGLSNESQLRAALYAGADSLVQDGIGSLTPKQRAAAVLLFTRAFMAMKKQLNGSAPADVAQLMAALAEADKAAGIDRVSVKAAESVDLATLETASEVH